jgi:hypothetical protein
MYPAICCARGEEGGRTARTDGPCKDGGGGLGDHSVGQRSADGDGGGPKSIARGVICSGAGDVISE